VSRIKVQSNGYGYSLYLNHPDGITSLYGHLSSYNARIDSFVKAYQYKNQTFKADIYLKNDVLPIKKGELIAYSGNSGSSAGPHLHFEIRNTSTQYPQNALRFKLPVKDNISPKINRLYLYEFSGSGQNRMIKSRREIPIKQNKGSYVLTSGIPISVSDHIGFSIESFDYLNDAPNRCGLYSIEMFVDGELYFHFVTDEFGFNESRYINAFSDYSLNVEEGIKAQKLFLMPNSSLSMYKYDYNDGIIYPQDGDTSKVDIYLKDVYGNITDLSFKIRGTSANELLKTNNDEFLEIFKWYESNDFDNHVFRLHIPSNSLYENLKFRYSRREFPGLVHPYIHSIASTSTPLQKSAELSLALSDSINIDPEKLCIVAIDDKDESLIYAGGTISGKWLKTSILEFGKYTIAADTLPPQIIPVNISSGKNMKTEKAIRFIVRDDLSGINDYKAFIDNEWVLFEHDAKNDMITYYFDKNRLKTNSNHELELYVSDKRNNTNLFHSSFIW
jgi:hypothetical protein